VSWALASGHAYDESSTKNTKAHARFQNEMLKGLGNILSTNAALTIELPPKEFYPGDHLTGNVRCVIHSKSVEAKNLTIQLTGKSLSALRFFGFWFFFLVSFFCIWRYFIVKNIYW
jgi:hypothetical protein